MQRRQRHSVTAFPYITNATDNSPVENADLLEIVTRRRQSVACQGQTATLHSRASGQNQESSRKLSLSYKPFLSVPQPSPTRRNSATASVSSRSSFSLQNENPPIDEFSSSTLTTEENAGSLSATGSGILHDSKKLPKILLTASPGAKQEKNKKKRKKKKAGKSLETALDEKFPTLIEEDGGGVSLEIPDSSDKAKNVDKSEEDDSIDWKYKLEAKYFQLGWDTTKAFTYSYFQKCEKVRKKGRKKNKKIAKQAGSSHLHIKT